MTPRERFNAIMHGQAPDRLPLWDCEGISESAMRRWVGQALVPLGMRKDDLVAFDPKTVIRLDTDPLPAFVGRTLADDGEYRTYTDGYGFTVRESKAQAVGPTYYTYLAGPVASRADWREMTRRFDPADARRLGRDWSPELAAKLNGSSGPVGLRIEWGPGRGVKNGYMMGLERFLETLADEPAFVEEIFDFWADFAIACLRPWLPAVRFDFVFFNEDGMGFRNSSLVSPEMYRRLWARPMRRVADFVRGCGVDVIGYNTSGHITPLIPVLLELGVNLHMPLEAAAGMDVGELRRRFGPELRLIGNIARQSLMDGPAAVEREFARKAPLAADGGYIPAIDDLVMPDMPYESLRRYEQLVRQYRPGHAVTS